MSRQNKDTKFPASPAKNEDRRPFAASFGPVVRAQSRHPGPQHAKKIGPDSRTDPCTGICRAGAACIRRRTSDRTRTGIVAGRQRTLITSLISAASPAPHLPVRAHERHLHGRREQGSAEIQNRGIHTPGSLRSAHRKSGKEGKIFVLISARKPAGNKSMA